MAANAEHPPPQTSDPYTTDKEGECHPNPGLSLSPSMPTDPALHEDSLVYPEGGREAWSVVFGAWCALTASLGLYNTAGVFQAYFSEQILTQESTSNIGWIFGVYAFLTFLCGVQIGPTFDAKGPRGLLIAGSVCTLVGIFALSACTEYYQFFLAWSVLSGLGSSLLLTPALGSISHWFSERRGLASGIAWTGSGFGGTIFPLMIQSLIPLIGWAWSIRVLASILVLLCTTSVVFCRGRVLPRNGHAPTWRDTLPDPRIFIDGTGAMSVTTAGVALIDLAYLIPITYVPSYYLERQGLSHDATLTGQAAFAYQLLAILNASSCLGRWIAGDIADRFGRYNTMIISLFLCVLSVICFFLPDVLVPNLPNTALLIIFVIFFGLVSGSNISLTPICLGQLCETQHYGRYYASCYTVVSFSCLISIPIAGSLLGATHDEGKGRFWAAVTFAGLCYVVALLCFIWVRVQMKGFNWRTKW